MTARQVPPEEGGPGWWLPSLAPNGKVLNFRTSRVYARHPHDFYREPEWAVDRLLERVKFQGAIHDPACGAGNVPFVARRAGYVATGADIVDRGAGAEIVNFFDDRRPRENIVTNPPYVLAERFIRHALSVATGKVAALVRLAFLEGAGRFDRLFTARPPAIVLIFSSRVSMPPGDISVEAKGGKTAYCWVVWEPECLGEPRLGWIR